MLAVLLGGCAERVELGPGVFAPAAPRQATISAAPFDVNGFRLQPQADFAITAKLLGKRRYRWDRLAALAPWDFAMGWGPMSDEALLALVDITQGDRFLFRHLRDTRLRPHLRRLERHSANLHLVPADASVAAQVAAVPEGAIATLVGQLVHARHLRSGRRWLTSLTRGDRGAGACEILYVTGVSVDPR